jgi:sugar phosphate isomerase/epimerase
MNNKLGLSAGFFKEPTVEKWKSALGAGFTEAEMSSGDSIADSAVEVNRKILDWVGGKGIGIAVLHASYEPISPDDRPARFERAVKSIKILGDYAKSRKVTLAVENLPRTCLGNCADEMLILTSHGKNAPICFDVNHLLVEHQRDFMAKTAPYIVTTHFSDYDRQNERHWMPGDGDIDWKELTGLFDKAGYKGRYIFEIDENSSPKLGRAFSPTELAARFKLLA